MGCNNSKSDHLPLVIRCRERRNLIRAAANHRYALAAAHVSYFRSLKDIGDALRAFVDEEFVAAGASSSSSSFSSPSLILPPADENNTKSKGGKQDTKKNHDEVDVDVDDFHLHLDDTDDDDDDSHLHLSDSSDEENINHVNHRGFDNEDGSRYADSRFNGGGFNQGMNGINNGFNNGYRPEFGQGIGNINNNYNGYNDYRPDFGGGMFGTGFGERMGNDPFSYPYSQQMPPQYGGPQQYMDPWSNYGSSNSNMYYMKKTAPVSRTVVQQPPEEPGYGYSDTYWTSPPGYNGYYPNGNNVGPKVSPPKEPPPPPSPKASGWDFFNPFDGFGVGEGGGYGGGYYSGGVYGYGSNHSSPDSTEVREREGIPELEEETETEMYKEVVNVKGKRMKNGRKSSVESSRAPPVHRRSSGGGTREMPMHKSENSRGAPAGNRNSGGGTRSVPMHKSESSAKTLSSWSSAESEQTGLPTQYNNKTESGMPSMPENFSGKGVKQSMPEEYNEESVKPVMPPGYGQESEVTSVSPSHFNEDTSGSISMTTEEKSSTEHIISTSTDDVSVKKKGKGVTFDVEGTSKQDGESSMLSSVTLLSPNGNRDLREVVVEIKDEFEIASSYGKEVAMMLEVGKLPYQPGFLKVLISRVLYMVSPSLAYRDPPSLQSSKLASKTTKLAKSYFEDIGNDVNANACNLSAVLDKLYEWEKKLYKEVKGEERLRMSYEKQCKKLKMLDQEGAESTKIEAAEESVRRLVTKLDVSVRAIDTISSRIHKLRDEELQPQVASLIQGLIRMWKAMLRCHKKQFQAIMDTKMRKLKANTGTQTDSSITATAKLEFELRAWCGRFSDWIHFQKIYVESLNGWLLQCLQYEPEVTSDGIIPYSPGRIGAPPIFVICHDWQQAMKDVPEAKVENAMESFATSLRQLWEKQDEEGRQRLRAEVLKKEYEKKILERGKLGKPDAASEKAAGSSVVASELSAMDDLKVDLDSMREKLNTERVKHKDAMKLVHDAASSSLKGGLVPIFKALESFTSEVLKSHEDVRLQRSERSS